MAQQKAVDINIAVGHDAIELDQDRFAGGVRGKGEVLAIPANAGWHKCAAAARRVVLVNGAFDAPIVRQVKLAPGGIHEIGLIGAFGVGAAEEPAGIEVLSPTGRDLARGDKGSQ